MRYLHERWTVDWVTRSRSFRCAHSTPSARLLDLIRDFDARAGWNNWLSLLRRVALLACRARSSAQPARRSAWPAPSPRCRGWRRRSPAASSRTPRSAPSPGWPRPETEERLLAVGRAGTAEHVERIVRGWRRVDRKAERDETARQHTQSGAPRVSTIEDGTVTIRGRLSPEAGAAPPEGADGSSRGAAPAGARCEGRRSARGRCPRKRRRWLSSRPTRCSSGRRPRSTTASIPAHAGRALSGGGPRRRRASWRIPMQPGQSVVEDGARVSAETSQRLACDASRVVMRHDEDGRICRDRGPDAHDPARAAASAAASGPQLPLPGLPRPLLPGPPHPALGPGRPDDALEPRAALPPPSPRRPRGGYQAIDSPMVSFASAGRMVASCLDVPCSPQAPPDPASAVRMRNGEAGIVGPAHRNANVAGRAARPSATRSTSPPASAGGAQVVASRLQRRPGARRQRRRVEAAAPPQALERREPGRRQTPGGSGALASGGGTSSAGRGRCRRRRTAEYLQRGSATCPMRYQQCGIAAGTILRRRSSAQSPPTAATAAARQGGIRS